MATEFMTWCGAMMKHTKKSSYCLHSVSANLHCPFKITSNVHTEMDLYRKKFNYYAHKYILHYYYPCYSIQCFYFSEDQELGWMCVSDTSIYPSCSKRLKYNMKHKINNPTSAHHVVALTKHPPCQRRQNPAWSEKAPYNPTKC